MGVYWVLFGVLHKAFPCIGMRGDQARPQWTRRLPLPIGFIEGFRWAQFEGLSSGQGIGLGLPLVYLELTGTRALSSP